MAMWFSHLRYVEAAVERLGRPVERLSLCWGALCCDVDKVSPVPREVSHYGHEGLAFSPEDFLARTGLAVSRARPHADFLAGYLSHLAVDEAWYRHLFALRDSPGGLGPRWSAETTRALNLVLDQRNRAWVDLEGLDFRGATGHEVLPHLDGAVHGLMVHAANGYVAWPGTLSWAPDDPVFGPVMARFRDLLEAEQGRVNQIEQTLQTERLDEEVIAFTADVVGRFLTDLDGREG